MEKPTNNQLSELWRILKDDPYNYRSDDLQPEEFTLLSFISYPQYKRLYALIINKKDKDLKEMMYQLGFKN
jgi:hypothetical protein